LLSFNYKEKESGIFGKILRPLIDLEIYSELEKDWIKIEDVLADTGADISILPRDTGELLIKDITRGELQEIKGIVPFARLVVYIHNLKFRINSIEFDLPVAIADSNDTPPILGRIKGLDLFDANFKKGQKINIES
jgi:hypothetical protein